MKSFVRRVFVGFFITLTTLSVSAQEIQPDNPFPRVKLVTSHGEIVVELNRHRAPLTVENFLKYVDIGSYDNTIFHRIVPDFVVQGGGYDQELNAKTAGAKIPNESGNGLKINTVLLPWRAKMIRTPRPGNSSLMSKITLPLILSMTGVMRYLGSLPVATRPSINWQRSSHSPFMLKPDGAISLPSHQY